MCIRCVKLGLQGGRSPGAGLGSTMVDYRCHHFWVIAAVLYMYVSVFNWKCVYEVDC